MSKPDEQGRGGVSRQEELLYGHYAPFVRKVGQLAVTVEDAERDLMRLRESSAEADQIEMGKVAPAQDMEGGRSPETRWLDDQIETMNPVYGQIVALHQRVSRECLERWQSFRTGPEWEPDGHREVRGAEEAQVLRQLVSYGFPNLSPDQVERACVIADSLDPANAGWRPPTDGRFAAPLDLWQVERSIDLTEESLDSIVTANPGYEIVRIAVSSDQLALIAERVCGDSDRVEVDPGLAARVKPGSYERLWRVDMRRREAAAA